MAHSIPWELPANLIYCGENKGRKASEFIFNQVYCGHMNIILQMVFRKNIKTKYPIVT